MKNNRREMKIILVRHGKPAIVEQWKGVRIYCREIPEYFSRYDLSGIDSNSFPPEETISALKGASVYFTSALLRSIESAVKIGIDRKRLKSDSRFNEAKFPWWPRGFIKLHPLVWAWIIRLLWFIGISPNCDNIQTARKRAFEYTKILIKNAEENKSCALIAHGISNYMIYKELIRLGWRKKSLYKGSYWGATELTKTIGE